MPELVARSASGEEWRNSLSPGIPFVVGRDKVHGKWATPWDQRISREHFVATWQDGQLHVRCKGDVRNPTFFKQKSVAEFSARGGEVFTIGDTLFAVIDFEPQSSASATPMMEMTCGIDELRSFKFADPGRRIEVLSTLPEVIRCAGTNEELEGRVVEVLLNGIPDANAAAIVSLTYKDSKPEVELRTWRRKDGAEVPLRISRRLAVDAIDHRKQCVWHQFVSDDSGTNSCDSVEIAWGICAPLPDEPVPGFGVYVTGASPATASRHDDEMRKGDLKFAELAADLFGAIRQARHFQTQAQELAKSFSPRVIEAIRGGDIDEVLKRQEVESSVLFCDLRGSCRIADEGKANLQVLWDRIREALGVMTGAIMDQQGVIGDFQGDAAMGFWGWPSVGGEGVEDQIVKACRAALAIQRRFAGFAKDCMHPLHEFACGIGIAHGPAIAGRLGTADQYKVGVFGPTVNLAARLESMTKYWKVPILVNEAVSEHLLRVRASGIRVRKVARVRPLGMSEAVTISQLIATSDVNESSMRTYESALNNFFDGQWDQALLLLQRLRGDGPSQALRSYIENANGKAPADWDGTLSLLSK